MSAGLGRGHYVAGIGFGDCSHPLPFSSGAGGLLWGAGRLSAGRWLLGAPLGRGAGVSERGLLLSSGEWTRGAVAWVGYSGLLVSSLGVGEGQGISLG